MCCVEEQVSERMRVTAVRLLREYQSQVVCVHQKADSTVWQVQAPRQRAYVQILAPSLKGL